MNARRRMLLALAISVAAAPSRAQDSAAVLATLEERLMAVVQGAEGSVVSVVAGTAAAGRSVVVPINPFGFDPARPGRLNEFPSLDDLDFLPERFGAGVVLAGPDGGRFVLTNHHLVRGGPAADPESDASRAEGQTQIYVRFADRRGYYAEIHASDPRSDLAVLRVDSAQLGIESPNAPDAFPKAIPLSPADEYRKGQFVFVFGNPYAAARDGSASVGWGIVGNVLRRPARPSGAATGSGTEAEATIHQYGTLLQLDCRLDLGFSGGAAVDRDGRLIGLTTSLAAIEGYESTTGFAIPIDAGTRRVIDALLRGHEAEYGFLGVEPVDVTAEQIGVIAPAARQASGAVRAGSVKAGSPADRAGLKLGDLILAIDGRPVRDTADLMRRVGLAGPGAEVVFEAVRPSAGRNTGRLTFRARLDKWPVVDDKEVVATVPRHEPWRGLGVDYATARARYLSPQLDPYPQGVVVLRADGAAGEADPVKPGDFVTAVNGTPVDSPAEFYAAVRDADSATLSLADGRQVSLP